MSDEKADEKPTGKDTEKSAEKPAQKRASPAAGSKGASGNPAKAGRTATAEKKADKRTRRSQKDEHSIVADDPFSRRQWYSPRTILGAVLFLGGIAWLAYYYLQVRPEPGAEPGGPAFMGDLARYNYLIGFGLIMVGLVVLAHKSTPLGRGRGVVVGMLGCFLVGLIWICTFYVITDDLTAVPVFNDLGQFNLMVGIAFMAVGFTYATKWE